MSKFELSSPWQTFYNQMKAMFGDDENIKISIDDSEDRKCVILFVTGHDKANALEKLLPSQKDFGGVKVDIIVKPSNEEMSIAQLYDVAFAGNPAFSFAKTLNGLYSNPLHYIVFKNKVVQFWDDNIGDIYGNISTLYQELAKEIFPGEHGELFCTDWPENQCLGKCECECAHEPDAENEPDQEEDPKADDELPWQ